MYTFFKKIWTSALRQTTQKERTHVHIVIIPNLLDKSEKSGPPGTSIKQA